jgi:3-deoxy-D-manno-octulosonic-acid transferase
MILILYNIALLVGLVVSAPWWLFRMATTQRYREGLWQRLGWLGRARSLERVGVRPLIWVHAVSVGEVLAVSRLVADLDAGMREYAVVVSTTTRTGQQLARERFGVSRVFYCPLDLPWAVSAYLHALRPAMLVLAETEFWPNLLHGCFRRGIPVAVVNARISDRSWPRYWRLRRLWRPILSRLSAVLAQTEVDAGRLRALGCGLERVSVSGNLKFDVRAGEQAPFTRQLRSLAGDRRLIVAGSTLDGEEQALLGAWPALLAVDPKLAMVLAPRHPERFDAVARLLEGAAFPWRRRTQIDAGAKPLADGEILLLDSIGELASLYSLAAVAFVGGSLVPAGGHNPLEPAQFGVPVVMGEHTANFRAVVDALLAAGGMVTAKAAEVGKVMAELLTNPVKAKHVGERGRRVFEQEAGATRRTFEVLRQLLIAQAKSPRGSS